MMARRGDVLHVAVGKRLTRYVTVATLHRSADTLLQVGITALTVRTFSRQILQQRAQPWVRFSSCCIQDPTRVHHHEDASRSDVAGRPDADAARRGHKGFYCIHRRYTPWGLEPASGGPSRQGGASWGPGKPGQHDQQLGLLGTPGRARLRCQPAQ